MPNEFVTKSTNTLDNVTIRNYNVVTFSTAKQKKEYA
jgi:hypothetical protein